VTESIAGGITVRRCVVRVVRRGGWSWGPEPHDLARLVVNALPDLLAERFGDQVTGDGPDVEITDPVSITVRFGRMFGTGRAPLADLVVEPTNGVAPPGATVAPGVAIETPPVDSPHGSGLTTESGQASVATSEQAEHGRAGERPSTPAVLFAELAERGELEPLLALVPDETLRLGLLALLEDPAWRTAPQGSAVMAALEAEFTRRYATEPLPYAEDDLLRLVRSLADPTATDPSAGSLPDTEKPVDVSSPPALASTRVATGETRTCSVLPFLLAGPLARIGYLDAIGPALAGVDLLAEAPLFAAALAYKVMAGPERGWRRTAEAHETAAAFAGLAEVPDLSRFAGQVRHALPVLDGVLALSLCRGHDPADPLLVSGVDEGLLLVDSVGLFPIAWAPDADGLLPHWAACGQPDVVVCDSPLPTSSLRDLATAGVQLITGIRPLRGDPLTRLPRPTPLWTAGRPDPGLASDLPAHTDRMDELVRELMAVRRVAPRSAEGALDRSATLAASLSLGLISWTLWREREVATPVLALTRFADLEASVRFEAEAVRVRVPLGRRHTDLLRGGALTDVHDVVWLGGRTLTFSGG
jgi:hypothetical protein